MPWREITIGDLPCPREDRLEIVNPGGLVGGLTVDTLGTRSIPRNPLLFGMMQRMDLVEKVGSGFKRIREYCDKQNCAHPAIQADKDWFRMLFRRKNAISAGASQLGNGLDKAHDEAPVEVEAPVDTASRLETRLESRLESRLAVKVFMFLKSRDLGKAELAEQLGHQTVSGELHKQAKRLMDLGIIEMTIPDKPNSRLQKYRLTDKGRALLKQEAGDE